MEHDELRAAELASGLAAEPQPPRSLADFEATLRELRVHQLELEAQNHALREAQGQLEESRSRYADLYDFAPVPSLAVDRAGIVLDINLAGAQLIGRERASIVGRPLPSLLRIDDYNALARHIREAIDSAVPLASEHSFTTALGPMEFQLVSGRAHVRQGDRAACRTVLLDITRRRMAEREARTAHESERTLRRRLEAVDRAAAAVSAALASATGPDLQAFFRSAIDQAAQLAEAEHAALGLLDGSGAKIETWLMGGPATELEAGSAPRASSPPPDAPEAALGQRFPAGCVPNPFPGTVASTTFMAVPVRYQGRNRANLCLAKSDGAVFTEEARITVEMLAERIAPMLEIARRHEVETRQQGAREQELVAARRAAETASAAKSDFLTSMSHELRTPLNALLGFVQLLHRDTKEPPTDRHRKRLEQILHSGEHVLRLIDDVLDLSRVETQQVTLVPERLAVAEVLGDVAAMLGPLAAEAEMEVDAEAVPAHLSVMADRVRLQQALMNYGSNAVKYGRKRTKVRLHAAERDGKVRITVTDAGVGIAADRQQALFKPFERAGQEAGLIAGTGLGLVLTKRLAELMGGSVGFRSVEGQGSDFWLELPAARAV